MSFQAMEWALSANVNDASERLILLMLANHADADGIASPGHTRLAADCLMTPRTVTDKIGSLCRAGTVAKINEYSGSGRVAYQLNIL
tara:strand:- start:2007 stop:2267 length:261 start_codon:yes stop_codon:yes gene_type:complete